MKEFQRIIRRAIQNAEEVDCSSEVFKVGLAVMYHELKERLECEDIDPQDEEVLDQMELLTDE